jgi:predicted nicotinamide N-methyase
MSCIANLREDSGAASNINSLLEKIRHLKSLKHYDAAEAVTSNVLTALSATAGSSTTASATSKSSATPTVATVLELLGDIVFEKREYKRAMPLFGQAFTQRVELLQDPCRPHVVASQMITCPELARLKFKRCLCNVEAREFSAALKDLELIPMKFRTEDMQMCAARLYVEGGLKRTAISTYKAVLTTCPYSVEAITALIELGIEGQEINTTIDIAYKEGRSNGVLSIGWFAGHVVDSLLEMHCSQAG